MIQIKKEQLEFLDWEVGAFFHFGIRTFYEGHTDWDLKQMPADKFNPTQLDCENWIKTAKDAGAKYAILVCKHHDGFANWPSKYTEYSVKNTPWKNGNGDVVREFTDACRKFGLKVGLYYSPAQFGSAKMQPKEYDDYFINQIGELFTNYGKIDYLWFDGCGSEGHTYDAKRIVAAIRGMQPQILIFNMWDPDTRWAGNEWGLAHMPNKNFVNEVEFSVQTEKTDALSEQKFLPAECDCRIRHTNWFYSENDADQLKSLEELVGMYHYSVGRGANLLVNIAPDRRGLLPEKDAARFIELNTVIKKMYAKPIGGMAQAKYENDRYILKLPETQLVDSIILEEDMQTGEHIENFSIYAIPSRYCPGVCVYRGETVGHKRICTFMPVRTTEFEIVIEKQNAEHKMKDINVYYTKKALSEVK